MAQTHFSLSWSSHTRNISDGLSCFQQCGEFVDMTLAADGHHVKVHQVIMALASPYIKELLASAPCRHPVLFFNNMSYKTLCAILEYIYTGEVYVSVDNLADIKNAAKELHIKGLENMNIPQSVSSEVDPVGPYVCEDMEAVNGSDLESNVYYEITNPESDERIIISSNDLNEVDEDEKIEYLKQDDDSDYEQCMEQDSMVDNAENNKLRKFSITETNTLASTPMQYTVSNQGSLQMILNRFIYYMKHSNRNKTQQWRCVDYLSNVKCPAHIITKNGVVHLRIAAHTHPFHDKKILKKMDAGIVYSAIADAREQGLSIKNRNNAANHAAYNNESSE